MKVFLYLIPVLFFFPPITNTENAQQDKAPVFRSNVDVVNILCTVRKKNDYVTDLKKEDFVIQEDGVPQEITYFSLETDDSAQPLNIILLIDTSGSVKDKLFFEQQAAAIFLEETLRKNKDLAAVVQFDSDINLTQDFTYDIGLLVHSIESIRAGGATKLYDAIFVSVDELLVHEVGRKVLVILSDGDDTQSIVSDKEAIKVSQDNDVIIFGIGVQGGRSRANFGKLKQFSRETGGLFFNSKARLENLRTAFSIINQALKNPYAIGYISTNQDRDGSFREIKVEVKKRGLDVAHRKGYYAPEI